MPRVAFAPCVLAVALALPACDDPPAVRALALTAPAVSTEVVPVTDDGLAVAWTADADHADAITLALGLAPVAGGDELPLVTAPLADGGALWRVPATPPPAGVYRLLGHARAGDDALADAAAPGLVVLQGVWFRDAELTYTSDPATRDLWLTTVVASESRALVYLAPTIDGPRQVIADAVIASDLAPVGRVITFTGATVDGALVPPGDHLAFVEVRTRNETVRYQRGGLTIHWRP